jgi:GntR family transcriptional regulator, transcriptional repressor for pyruvate dehydrogenase complex
MNMVTSFSPLKITRETPSRTLSKRKEKNTPKDGYAMRPLHRLNLVNEVVDQIREQIFAGRFPVGQPLSSAGQLCRDFGVSRTVIREAMRILQAQGLVDVSQGRQARIRPLDPQDLVITLGTFLKRGNHSLLDLVEVRRPLESEIAALAAQRATPEQIDAMRQANAEMARVRSLDARIECDLAFHNILATATGNPVFSVLLGVVMQLLRESRRQTISRTGLAPAISGHRAVLAAVEQRDSEKARISMLEHLDLAKHDLQEAGR